MLVLRTSYLDYNHVLFSFDFISAKASIVWWRFFSFEPSSSKSIFGCIDCAAPTTTLQHSSSPARSCPSRSGPSCTPSDTWRPSRAKIASWPARKTAPGFGTLCSCVQRCCSRVPMGSQPSSLPSEWLKWVSVTFCSCSIHQAQKHQGHGFRPLTRP